MLARMRHVFSMEDKGFPGFLVLVAMGSDLLLQVSDKIQRRLSGRKVAPQHYFIR
ncbi:hypothetical protein PT7_0079 [Pusillimonas sp. T7-7]|nr:hypothetical protein PT7_0079 [Pusillimonas sp. T7-7]